jgi:hypothetical protein
MPFLKRTNFNDGPVRNAVINFFKTKFDISLNETPQEMKVIDLTGATETLLGVEVEGGGWGGDFWSNNSYCMISGHDFKTINIPIRKSKYWMERYKRYSKDIVNPSYDKNIFVRSNKDFTQMIVIRPETIRDENKLVVSKFQPNNSNEVEEWMSFRREHVETYNLIENNWTIDESYGIQ